MIGGAPPIPDPPPVHTSELDWAELGAFERTRQDDAEAGVHRQFIPPIRSNLPGPGCAEQGKGPANARAGYSASLARRQGPVAYRGVAAHPHAGSNSRAQHVACIQSAEGQLRGPEDQQRTWLPAGWLRTTARDMKPCRDGPAASAEPGARLSAGPITANPAHLSQQGLHGKRADCCPLPRRLPRLVHRRDFIHPPFKAWRGGPGARRRVWADRAATSGNGEPLRLPPCDALRPRIRAGHDAPPPGTHCPPLRRPPCGRYVSGYVRGTIHRYAAHTVRRYVSDMVWRYAVGYVCRNLAQQRAHHARCPVNGGLLGRVRHYARSQVVGCV